MGTLNEADESEENIYGSNSRSRLHDELKAGAIHDEDLSNSDSGVNPMPLSVYSENENESSLNAHPVSNRSEPPSQWHIYDATRESENSRSLIPRARQDEDPVPFDRIHELGSASSEASNISESDTDEHHAGMRRSTSEPSSLPSLAPADHAPEDPAQPSLRAGVRPSFRDRPGAVRKPSMLADRARKKEFARSRWAKANWWATEEAHRINDSDDEPPPPGRDAASVSPSRERSSSPPRGGLLRSATSTAIAEALQRQASRVLLTGQPAAAAAAAAAGDDGDGGEGGNKVQRISSELRGRVASMSVSGQGSDAVIQVRRDSGRGGGGGRGVAGPVT